GGSSLEIEIATPDGGKLQHSFPVAEGRADFSIPLHPVILWDPNDPQLYKFKLTLHDEVSCDDVVHSYFGMRSLSAELVEDSDAPSALVFNGQPIYLRGALYQSYHAEGVYTAGDVRALHNDILFAKMAGFDMLRVHIKIDDPLLLHAADTLGMLLMADFPNFGEGGDTPLGRRRFEEMMRAGVARDFNHPSIIAWCLFNETWGFGGQAEFVKLINPSPPSAGPDAMVRLEGAKFANESAYAWVQAMWQLAKSLDPTRLVEDMSVVAWDHLDYYGHGDTDVNSWHFYTDSYDKARAHIEEVVEKSYAGSTFNFVAGHQQGAQPLINSEYGGVGALDGDVDTSWTFKFLTNELRRHGKLSAYIYTELHDVEWERNGMLNYDRTPKDFGYDTTLINQGDVLPIDAPPIQRCSPGQQIEVDVFSSHFSRRVRDGVMLQWSLSGTDSLGWLHGDLASGWKHIPFRQHRVELAEHVVLTMPQQTMLCTFWVRAVTAEGAVIARNYVQFFNDAGHLPYEEVDGRIVLRAEPHAWVRGEWSDGFSSHAEAEEGGVCWGGGQGFFEWAFDVSDEVLRSCSRIRVLCEASAHRAGTPQTDSFTHPTAFRMELNGVRIYNQVLPNHPHDTRGALSYLHGKRGAYGYLAQATVEGPLFAEVLEHPGNGVLRLLCAVPADAAVRGGCTLYGRDSGRYPMPLTVILEK
ncbi:MAG: glycoside hydrolase family 2 sugar binding, partial [Prosthecobacter sp.]|nr:glycoside hydrolase family 2 sugar binding [Prosthecobacter sp.]